MDADGSARISIRPGVELAPGEISWSAVRAQGAGGQNVNKVASAVHLRFDIKASSLPERDKQALLASRDRRITADGVVIIKAQRFRTRERNLDDALERLRALIVRHTAVKPPRKPTRPSAASRRRRLDAKSRRGALKRLRGSVED